MTKSKKGIDWYSCNITPQKLLGIMPKYSSSERLFFINTVVTFAQKIIELRKCRLPLFSDYSLSQGFLNFFI